MNTTTAEKDGRVKDLLLNVKETDNNESSSELIKRHEIEDTPFTVIEIEGVFFGVMGQYRLTDERDNFDEVEKLLKDFTWNRVIQVLLLMSEQGLLGKNINELNKEENE